MTDVPPDAAPITEGVDADPSQNSPSPRVSLESITTAPIEIPVTLGDSQAQREKEALAHDRAQFNRELGWLGKPFGGRREKPGNISALVISMCFLIIVIAFGVNVYVDVAYAGRNIQMPIAFDKLFASVTSLITLVLGYLFGSNDKNEK